VVQGGRSTHSLDPSSATQQNISEMDMTQTQTAKQKLKLKNKNKLTRAI
jgi:hypothetical protein